jgi:hypothetical protein
MNIVEQSMAILRRGVFPQSENLGRVVYKDNATKKSSIMVLVVNVLIVMRNVDKLIWKLIDC